MSVCVCDVYQLLLLLLSNGYPLVIDKHLQLTTGESEMLVNNQRIS